MTAPPGNAGNHNHPRNAWTIRAQINRAQTTR
jgi:hypothetical protein